MKKSLKILFFILLTSLLTIFMISCEKNEKPSKKEVIEKFVENSKDIRSADMITKMSMKEKSNDSLHLNFNMEASVITEPLTMKISMIIPIQEQKMEMYIKDEYLYILNPTNKQWSKQLNQDLNGYFKNYISDANEIYDVIKNNIDKINLEEKNGNYIIIIPENSNLFKDSMKKQMSKMNISNNEALDNLEIDNVFLTYTIDKKTYLPIYSYNSFDLMIEGVKMNMVVDTEFKNINKIKEIELPKEVEEAIEIII